MNPSLIREATNELPPPAPPTGVEVVTLTPAEYDAWVKVAQQSSYKRFSDEVSDGKKLIDAALAVK